MKVDLNSLVLFTQIVEANGFSNAARRLGMPVSTVSRKFAAFEDGLGVRLLERSTRRLRLTDIGSEILELGQRGAEIGDAVAGVVSDRSTDISGLLRLSAPPSVADSVIAPLVTAFQRKHPDVRVSVLVTDRFVDHIAEGVDLVIRAGVLADSTLVAKRVARYRHELMASRRYLDRYGWPKTPDDLAAHRLIAFSPLAQRVTWTLIGVTGERAVSFQPYLAMNDYLGVAKVVGAGHGIGELPPVVRPDVLRGGDVVTVLADWAMPETDVSIVHLSNRHLPRAVRAFKTFATEQAPAIVADLTANIDR